MIHYTETKKYQNLVIRLEKQLQVLQKLRDCAVACSEKQVKKQEKLLVRLQKQVARVEATEQKLIECEDKYNLKLAQMEAKKQEKLLKKQQKKPISKPAPKPRKAKKITEPVDDTMIVQMASNIKSDNGDFYIESAEEPAPVQISETVKIAPKQAPKQNPEPEQKLPQSNIYIAPKKSSKPQEILNQDQYQVEDGIVKLTRQQQFALERLFGDKYQLWSKLLEILRYYGEFNQKCKSAICNLFLVTYTEELIPILKTDCQIEQNKLILDMIDTLNEFYTLCLHMQNNYKQDKYAVMRLTQDKLVRFQQKGQDQKQLTDTEIDKMGSGMPVELVKINRYRLTANKKNNYRTKQIQQIKQLFPSGYRSLGF